MTKNEFQTTVQNIVIPELIKPITGQSVYVDSSTGNNGSGVAGSMVRPFLTINAALDALPSTGGNIYISRGTYASPDSAKLKSGVNFYGSGRPVPNIVTTVIDLDNQTNTSPTRLLGGTILLGSFWIPHDVERITIENLGVDVGLDYVNAFHGGTAQEGLLFSQEYDPNGGLNAADGTHTLQTYTNPRRGIRVHNIAVLNKSPDVFVHAFVVEDCAYPDISDIYTYYGFAGIVVKCIGGTYRGLHAFGHGLYGIALKSNDYAYNIGIVVSDFECGSIGTYDGEGLHIISDIVTSGYFTVSNGVCRKTKSGILTTQNNGGIADNLLINNVMIYQPQSYGINVSGALMNIQNCIVRGSGTTGIRVVSTNNVVKCSVTGCSSDGNTGYGFDLTDCLTSGLRALVNGSGGFTGSGNTAF